MCIRDRATTELRHAGIEEAAALEARLLVAHALGIPKEAILRYPEQAFDAPAVECLQGLLHRRLRREPISHLLGCREFWSLPFRVTPNTFDPRPDSETLISAALDHYSDNKTTLRMLDLGTGSGCLILALLSEFPYATGLGVDISSTVLSVAKSNASALGLQKRACFLMGDWGKGINEKFDLIISNPPYIPGPEIDRLQPEIALYESRIALDGGIDGLACYRKLVPDLIRLLQPSGTILLEVGDGQSEAVVRILTQFGLEVTRVQKDFCGISRCVVGRLQRAN